MCFSTTASSISGTALCVIGVAMLKQTKAPTEIPFAFIPLLFGIQQLTQGVIWLSFSYKIPVLRQVMTYLYSLFSHLLWPIYVPLAVGIMKEVRWRKKALHVILVIGITLGLFLLYWITAGPLNAKVISHHIVYISPHFYSVPAMILYFTATCVSCFFSSHGFNHSAIPAIAVPYKYKATGITSILYASDLAHFKKEIIKVVANARPLKATIDLLHLTSVLENSNQLKAIKVAVKKIADYHINFNMTNRNPNDSFITDIETVIKKNKPSIIIMFTEQQRSWFDKIFLSSKSAAYSFNAKVPLLVFNKTLDK